MKGRENFVVLSSFPKSRERGERRKQVVVVSFFLEEEKKEGGPHHFFPLWLFLFKLTQEWFSPPCPPSFFLVGSVLVGGAPLFFQKRREKALEGPRRLFPPPLLRQDERAEKTDRSLSFFSLVNGSKDDLRALFLFPPPPSCEAKEKVPFFLCDDHVQKFLKTLPSPLTGKERKTAEEFANDSSFSPLPNRPSSSPSPPPLPGLRKSGTRSSSDQGVFPPLPFSFFPTSVEKSEMI